MLAILIDGQLLARQSLLQMDGGPIGNNSVTTSIAYDAMGRIYINDHVEGEIYRRDGNDPWEKYADVRRPDDMHFDASGNLLVASRVDHTTTDLISFDSSGSGTPLATELGRFESFTLDSTGNIIFPEIGGDLYRVSPLGQVDFLGVGTAGPGRFGPNVNVESIAPHSAWECPFRRQYGCL